MHIPTSGLAVHHNDQSVLQPQYLHSWDMNERNPLESYPHHTRVVMRQSTIPVCSLAYAISQRDAQKLLYALGLKKLDAPFNVILRAWCQGSEGFADVSQVCPGVIPQLFDHYRRQGPKSADSDISKPKSDVREHPVTLNIRWSVRMNMERIVRGDTNYEDQYSDV